MDINAYSTLVSNIPLLDKTIRILVISLIAVISQKIIKKSIRSLRRRFKPAPGETPSQRTRRLQTVTSLLNNTANIIISIVFVFLILSELGVNLIPFLTGASILGLAIGMGMKDLASDMVAGFFLLLDNQINVGDQVEIGSAKGAVRKIGLRTITLRDKEGRYYYIPNSAIKIIIKNKRTKTRE